MPQAQIRWYSKSQQEGGDFSWTPDGHYWNVLIVNRGDKIPLILDKLYKQAQPIQENFIRMSGKIPETDLSYQLISLVTRGQHPSELEWDKIFRGKITKDRELRNRRARDDITIYVDSHIEQLSS